MNATVESLTAKQKKVYNVIEEYRKNKGIPPTVREIGEILGEKKPSAVQGILDRLHKKGIIKKEVGLARSIQIVGDSQYKAPFYVPEIKQVNKRNLDNLFSMYNVVSQIPLSGDMWDLDESCFIVDCPDISLNESSSITYGDKLIISTKREPKDNNIVMIEYEGHILLKRYFRNSDSGNTVRLEADSDLYGKEVFRVNEFRVVGLLVGVVKRY
jgi:repressor LexA